MKFALDSLKLVVFSTKSTVIFEISCMNCSRVISFLQFFELVLPFAGQAGARKNAGAAASRN